MLQSTSEAITKWHNSGVVTGWHSANLVCLGGTLSLYKGLLDEFVALMLRNSWGKGRSYPFERLPGNKLDKSVIAKPGFEWLSNERDSDEGNSDEPGACARANRLRNKGNASVE